MKRSEINRVISDTIAFCKQHRFALPPFAYWTPEEWKSKGPEAEEIRSRKLGWDVTDFGSGNFRKTGLTVFTVRNGKLNDPGNKKNYAEKIMLVHEDQITPLHFHWSKTEDIINRAGGELVVTLYNSKADQVLDRETPVQVQCDGVERTVPPGNNVILDTGESITLLPGVFHEFKALHGSGGALIGEVSSVNDDATDNNFLGGLPRFPELEEDTQPTHLLCTEYP